MTSFQTTVKYIAIVFAVCLAVGIIGGILGALGIACGFFGDDGVLDGMKTYEISENITDIRIEINAADLTVSTADGFSLESNLKYLSVKENDGCLVITEKKRFGINYDAPELKLCIPEGLVFGEATIITGAGRVSIDTLCADKLKMELGAGAVRIDSLGANSKAKINGGAGRLTIGGGSMCDLDLDMGVGELNCKSKLCGSCELDYGVGSANLVLIGTKEDYRVELNKGIGDAELDGQSVGDGIVYGDGSSKVEIDGGIGKIKVSFEEN